MLRAIWDIYNLVTDLTTFVHDLQQLYQGVVNLLTAGTGPGGPGGGGGTPPTLPPPPPGGSGGGGGSGTHVYVADSNIFMDRVEGGSAQRARIDKLYLDNPNVTLIVCASAVAQVLANDPFGTQAARLAGHPGGARIVQVPDPNLAAAAAIDPAAVVPTSKFDLVDINIVETARQMGLPVLTAQAAFSRQIAQYPPRAKVWGGVPVIVP